MRKHRQGWIGTGLGWWLLALPLLSGCQAEEAAVEPHRGPIVLITLDALRADVVGSLGGPAGLTPNLDRLASEASWAGRAVAPSSWTVPSMASLFTGLPPWKHQALHAGQARLRSELLTLPEALKQLGYTTAAYRSNHWLSGQFGYAQGFDWVHNLNRGRRAAGHLASLGDSGPESETPLPFLWIHILAPHTPYVLRPPLLDRLQEIPHPLPQTVRPLDLEPYYDPETELPPAQRDRFWALYCLNVAWADRRLGLLLDALRDSGQWERTLLVVASDHGEEFGEHGQVAHGGNLGRVLVEVPLMIKLPQGFPRSLAALPPRSGGPVATQRLWATLVEAAGGEPVPAAAPSLFQPPGSAGLSGEDATGVLSEIYLGNGVNEFSLVQGSYQLHWKARFGPSEPEFFRARWTSLGGKPVPPVSEPVARIFGRLEAAFHRTLPLSGNGVAPELRLERWTQGGVEPVEDPQRLQRLARLLRRQWLAYLERELPPAEMQPEPRPTSPEDRERLRSLGYVAR